MSRYEIRSMSFGEILDAGFQLVRDHPRTLIGISACLQVPVALLHGESIDASAAGGLDRLRFGAGMLLIFVGAPIAATAINWAVGEMYVGRPSSIGRAWRAAWSILLPATGTILLAYLASAGTFGILAVAGVGLIVFVNRAVGIAFLAVAILVGAGYLFIAFLLLSQVMVLEHSFGRAALRRSLELVRGHRLRALGIFLVGLGMVAVLIGAPNYALRHLPVIGPLAVGLAGAAGTAYTSTTMVLLYFDIRCRKEAFDLEHLAGLVQPAPPSVAREFA